MLNDTTGNEISKMHHTHWETDRVRVSYYKEIISREKQLIQNGGRNLYTKDILIKSSMGLVLVLTRVHKMLKIIT